VLTAGSGTSCRRRKRACPTENHAQLAGGGIVLARLDHQEPRAVAAHVVRRSSAEAGLEVSPKEGVRRIDEWGRIRDRIPSTDMVVRFVEQPGEKAKGVNLAPEEWRVFARINGRDTLTEISQKTNMSEFDVCRIVYGFLTAGLVEVIKKPKPMPVMASGRPMAEPPRVKKSLVSRIITRIRGM